MQAWGSSAWLGCCCTRPYASSPRHYSQHVDFRNGHRQYGSGFLVCAQRLTARMQVTSSHLFIFETFQVRLLRTHCIMALSKILVAAIAVNACAAGADANAGLGFGQTVLERPERALQQTSTEQKVSPLHSWMAWFSGVLSNHTETTRVFPSIQLWALWWGVRGTLQGCVPFSLEHNVRNLGTSTIFILFQY